MRSSTATAQARRRTKCANLPCRRCERSGRGRDGDYSPPPAQIPACSFPAPGSCRRSNVIAVRDLTSPIVAIRRRATPMACFVRHRVRSTRCRPPSLRPGSFPPRSPPPLIADLFERFAGTMGPSDSSPAPRQLRLLDFLSRSRTASAIVDQARSPRFRHRLFARDGVFDLGGATASRMTTPHMLPSTLLNGSAPTIFWLSRLNSPPHAIVVYASQPPSPTTTQHSLPGVRYDLPGPDFHRLDSASLPVAQAIQSYVTQPLDCFVTSPRNDRSGAAGAIQEISPRRLTTGPSSQSRPGRLHWCRAVRAAPSPCRSRRPAERSLGARRPRRRRQRHREKAAISGTRYQLQELSTLAKLPQWPASPASPSPISPTTSTKGAIVSRRCSSERTIMRSIATFWPSAAAPMALRVGPIA